MASANPLGDRIRNLRKEKGLTLDQLAEQSGSSKSYIWELENKSPPRPSAEKLAKEVLRLGALNTTDELELLQMLYVDLEPAYQITFLDAAGVPHENGVMGEDLVAPYAAMVQQLVEQHYSAVSRYTASSFQRMKLGAALQQRGLAPHLFENADDARRDIESGA